jgi:hypothetical protein
MIRLPAVLKGNITFIRKNANGEMAVLLTCGKT